MKQVELAVRVELDEICRPAGITALQYTALTVLERHADLTAAHLARHSFVTQQSMAEMVTVLLDLGLVERHRDPADRRRLVIALTPPGRRLLGRLRPKVAALEDRMLAQHTTAQAARTAPIARGVPAGTPRPDAQETCTSCPNCGFVHIRD